MIWQLIQSFIRHTLTGFGAALVTKGLATQSQTSAAIGALMVLIAFGHSLYAKWKASKPAVTAVAGTSVPIKTIPVVLGFALVLLMTGCSTIVNDPQGKIVSVTTRVLGVDIAATDTTTQTPHVYLGFVSQNVTLEPTCTNGVINTANFANTFGDTSTSLLDWGINESLSSGNYETLATGATNSAATTIPVLPK